MVFLAKSINYRKQASDREKKSATASRVGVCERARRRAVSPRARGTRAGGFWLSGQGSCQRQRLDWLQSALLASLVRAMHASMKTCVPVELIPGVVFVRYSAFLSQSSVASDASS